MITREQAQDWIAHRHPSPDLYGSLWEAGETIKTLYDDCDKVRAERDTLIRQREELLAIGDLYRAEHDQGTRPFERPCGCEACQRFEAIAKAQLAAMAHQNDLFAKLRTIWEAAIRDECQRIHLESLAIHDQPATAVHQNDSVEADHDQCEHGVWRED